MSANIPTVAPTAEIELFGEKHTIKYTFRSYKELGINPFDKKSIDAYNQREKDLAALAESIRAGLLHEYYGRRAPRKGEECPTVEDLIDELDPVSYVDIWVQVAKVMGVDTDEAQTEPAATEDKPADPPQA